MKFICIVPVYNEDKRLQALLEEINYVKTLHKNLDFIIIDNGSDDSSSKIISNFEIKNIKFEKNFGVGYALMSGLKYAIKHDYESRALRLSGDDLRLACHKAITAKAQDAVTMALDLARRAGRLQAISPKLRAKGADAAIALFLSHDALSPSLALTGLMSDRAARRLCDRLVALGALRELTGRATFRLYGV